MKAVVMTSVGGPEVLKIQDVADPVISKEREVLIKVRAAGVNPVDTKLRRHGTYYPEQKPTILGCDGAGVIAEVGAGVSRFEVGDEVYFCSGGLGGPHGNYAEYIVIDERFVARKPASMSFAQAAAAPLVLITAWESLHDRARLDAGQCVLVHAGAGGVGHVAVQLVKLGGAQVCTTVGSEEKAGLASYLGADKTILYKKLDFVKEVLQWTDGAGADIALDSVGGETFQKTFAAVRVYGDLVTLLKPLQEVDWTVARTRNLRISLEIMLTPMLLGMQAAREHQREVLESCAKLIDAGKLEIVLSRTAPLEDASDAHRLIEAGSMTGKVVLIVAE